MKFKNIHAWELSPKDAVRVQNELRKRIKLKGWQGEPPRLIASADVAFRKDRAVGAVVVVSYPEFKIIEEVCKTTRISYPYIPGLLTFREGPVLEECFMALKNEPEVIIFDGQGIAHSRNMGIAAHIGVLLDRPTIGCAKTHLFGKYEEPANYRGAFSYLLDTKGEKIGTVLRTKDNVKAVYVSPGHKMDIESSIRIVLMCTKKYRLPEPVRLAHHLTKKFA